MPIYEYQCQSCGHELEALQRLGDEPLVDCPTCQEPRLRRLVSAASFRLMGTGWYETDFKGGSQAPAERDDAAAASAAAGESGSESRSADSRGGGGSEKKPGAEDAAKDAAKSGTKDAEKPATETARPRGDAAATAKPPNNKDTRRAKPLLR